MNHTQHLSAGTAIVEVTPKAGVSLGGYPHHPRYNQGVHDPLCAACLFLDDGVTKVAIVNMDVISFSKKHVRAVREEASRRTSIPAGNILISCSHSHSAPRASTNFTMDAMEGHQEPDADFVDSLNRKLVSLIVEASAAPFPARLGVEKGFCGREQGVGGNRRDPLGLADPEVWTIGVQGPGGEPARAILVKYSLHPTFLHSDNLLVSADSRAASGCTWPRCARGRGPFLARHLRQPEPAVLPFGQDLRRSRARRQGHRRRPRGCSRSMTLSVAGAPGR